MARVELSADENFKLLREIEANRAFILLAYQSDPELLKRADPEIRRHFENADEALQDTNSENPGANRAGQNTRHGG
ncbi:MAG: hypothetical protein A3H35_04190 [Betaproteobacteria bacterium RIFCSPLOWO2_02_FULL_62_17]|nr:MAG: hypothetical protein A3H35_04190 [Betaproteobacteria bacterium RIFCSPLOWO2_02_FULL_62_17]